MAHTHYVIRDSKGFVRVPENIPLTKKQANDIVEIMFLASGKDIGIKQLEVDFSEYDKRRGLKGKRKGPTLQWTDEERKYVLLHHEDGDTNVGVAMGELGIGGNTQGRSGMAIRLYKSGLLSELELFKQNHAEEIIGKTREQIIDMYLGSDE